MNKDIRTLCTQCANDMKNAGYKLYKLDKPKVRCDKCIRIGFTFEVKEK